MIDINAKEYYCIRDYEEKYSYNNCHFKRDNTYRINYSNNHIIMYDNDNNILSFDLNSTFEQKIFPKYFVTLKVYRRIKLNKINKNISIF